MVANTLRRWRGSARRGSGKHWGRGLLVAGLVTLLSVGTASASPTLRVNSHGHDVLLLQKKLKSVGYQITEIDGVFGKETERAVLAFQRDQEIKATGVVNNATWRALRNAKSRPWGIDIEPPTATKSVAGGQAVLPKGTVSSLIATAKKYIGTPYVFGGTTPKGFDCSGYLQYIFAKHGINIPRTADAQYNLGKRAASLKELVPGDLVFFSTYEPGPSHCGLYLGNNKFIHASSSKGIRIDEMTDGYWQPRYIGGKHIVK